MTHSVATLVLRDSTSRPFYFRPETSDERVVRAVLQEFQYNLNWLPRYGELMTFIRQHEAKGLRPLIVDAGANIGAASVFFADNFPPAHVVALEPEDTNFELLVKNSAGLSIEPVRAAVASTSGRARVVDAGMGHWGYRTELIGLNDPAGSVPCLTIDEIYASHGPPYVPFLVKIDIEGAESELFSRNTDWIERTPVLIIELHDWMLPKSGSSGPFLRCISQLRRDYVSWSQNVCSIAHDLEALTIKT
jgi:FkbM family methyltransferase